MKKITNIASGITMLAAVIASLALVPRVSAQLVLIYEDTQSGHAVGETFSGSFKINLQDLDMGTLYNNSYAEGTSKGFGQGGTDVTVAGGIATLNGEQTSAATGANPAGGEDSWGIAKVLTITDAAGSVIWSEANRHQQLTVMFYGEQDFYLRQLAGGFQEINGVGMHADLYLQNYSDVGYTAYSPLAGSLGRTGMSSYTTVTDGNNILQLVSTPGFLHPDGTLGGAAAEFLSNYNASSGGTGQAYFSVVGGTQASQFDTNGYPAPFLASTTADLFAQFTTHALGSTGNPHVSDWLVSSNDPVSGDFVGVPEPSTYGFVAAATLAGIVALRRRTQKSAIA